MGAFTEDVRVQRLVGRYGDPRTGPRLVCVAGMHGNEPAGVAALREVFQVLGQRAPKICGEFIGIIGNLSALEEGVRFIDSDLNRSWTKAQIARVRTGNVQSAEDGELKALLELIDDLVGSSPGDVYFLDLHTTSGDGSPFALIGDTLRNRHFAVNLPVPIILGLEEQLSGTITEYVNAMGAISVGFEAGRHYDADSVTRHEAALWLALKHACNMDLQGIPEADQAGPLLVQAANGLPRILQVRYRHGVTEEDRFHMRPGFDTFRKVARGDLLAFDKHGDIAAPIDGMVMLPLYQAQGSDGFFLAEPVNRCWLALSAILRRIRADHILRFFPGVAADPKRPGVLIVDPRIARFLATDIFHLFGFRRCRPEGDNLVFERRMHDFD